ncbi:hypothetical protein B0H14DRAFT_2585084 [Mycena olivaceomarginata]|nr:hypothetical protein B0H14DRAFT_2585084 [Mycena olivaceomarginata]
MALGTSDPDEASNLTSGLTSILACMIPVLALAYIGGVLWTLDYGNRRRTPLDKPSSLASHRYAPIAYAFIVITSLVAVAIPSWILLQYTLNQNYPNAEAQIGMRLVLFVLFCTLGNFTSKPPGLPLAGQASQRPPLLFFFVHPKWTKHPICSIGAQSIWVLLTWTFWLASRGCP